MAGIPPLIGFFSKQFVLFSSIENGNHFLSIIAILVSVISASYYLRLIKITFFDNYTGLSKEEERIRARNITVSGLGKAVAETSIITEGQALTLIDLSLTSVHSYIISILTFIILFFFLDPTILLNGTQLISLTIFNI